MRKHETAKWVVWQTPHDRSCRQRGIDSTENRGILEVLASSSTGTPGQEGQSPKVGFFAFLDHIFLSCVNLVGHSIPGPMSAIALSVNFSGTETPSGPNWPLPIPISAARRRQVYE